MSPFLYILASEYLSQLFQKAETTEQFHGIKVTRNAPPVSHLLFPDDLFVFCCANLRESRVLDEALSAYCHWSGKYVDKSKSAIHFSRNTHPEVIQALCNDLRLSIMKSDSKFLGILLFMG